MTERTPEKRGRLKVFIGMSAGVGKTRALLEAARREQAAGRDVVVGCLGHRGPEDKDPLAEGLPWVTPLEVVSRGRVLVEMDLDAVLARRPELLLVDQLAHSNAPASRHPKRYQDVLELLDAGIDVFTTLNLQSVGSRAEAVRQITGAPVQETVPDAVLEAAEFELVDLPADELRARFAADGKYGRELAWAAQQEIFRPGSLSALRELTLRFVAEHVGREVISSRQAGGAGEPWKSGQRLIVGVSPGPTAAALLRWTRHLAGELHATWLAVHVEMRGRLGRDAQTVLARNLALARELGAEVVTTRDEDVARGLLRVAREQQASQIVLGKPRGWKALDVFRGGSLVDRVLRDSGDIDVHAIRAEGGLPPPERSANPRFDFSVLREYGVAFAVVAAITAVNALLHRWLGYHSLGLVYLPAISILAMFVRRGPTLAAAALTTLAWEFFFEPPVFSFRLDSLDDVITTITFFIVAFIIGNQTSRLRDKEAGERRREQHATGLYLLTRALVQASHVADLLAIVTEEVGKAAHAEVTVSLAGPGPDDALKPYPGGQWTLSGEELKVAAWALLNRQAAGHGTGTSPSAEGLHLPLVAGERALGLLSLRFRDQTPLATDQRDLLDAFVRHIALALDRERLREAEQRAKLVAESERLSKTLLNSISHEMRTPLAAITSAASTLAESPEDVPPQLQKEMADEIQEAAQRLNRLVGNLLNMTRLETGHVKPKLDWCDVEDLVQVTLDEIENDLTRHRLAVEIAPGLPLVRMDFVLMQQVLTNLLLNAALYTPPGTTVHLTAATQGGALVLSVADNGPGLPAEALPQLFEKFYRGPAAAAGGTGLGLAIVKGFVEAQGGQVSAQNRTEGGALFTVRLPSPGRSFRNGSHPPEPEVRAKSRVNGAGR
ncbi:MAG TPA: ATP-binding protein [Dongiaceae bacterium]|nr:ATP-binding protein [Dongiaceae bacterium]